MKETNSSSVLKKRDSKNPSIKSPRPSATKITDATPTQLLNGFQMRCLELKFGFSYFDWFDKPTPSLNFILSKDEDLATSLTLIEYMGKTYEISPTLVEIEKAELCRYYYAMKNMALIELSKSSLA